MQTKESMRTGAASVSSPAVVVKDLVKVFPNPAGGELRAVDGVSFEVQTGEIFGFLGPNGAGKTTTLEIIEGLRDATSGHVEVLGIDVFKDSNSVKQKIGVQLQAGAYYEFLRLEELLDLFGSFYAQSAEPMELLTMVGLQDKRKALVGQLSGGQAQRFSIIASLVNKPEVVFLDEPTTGLDPQARHNLWETVQAVRDSGTTVVMTTHYMEEAEVLCDRVAIIDHGQIKALDTPLTLVQSLDTAYHIRFATSDPVPTEQLRSLHGAVKLDLVGSGAMKRYDLQVHRAGDVIEDFGRIMKTAAASMDDFRVEPATLEDVFISLTGRELRD